MKPTQKQRILTILRDNLGRFVPMPAIVERIRSCALNQRIADLRRDGNKIENRKIYVDGRWHSSWRLTV